MDLGLAERVVLITGAGGGAGPAIARAFAAEGAAVALHQRRAGTDEAPSRAEETATAIVAGGGRAMTVEADLGSTEAVDAMAARVREAFGPVTVLVTATSAYRTAAVGEIGDEDWSSVVEDMLGATFRVSRAVSSDMTEAGWGRIVNIAARSGLVGVAKAAHYAAAKGGIVALTASLAKELGPRGVLVNAVAPTQVLTQRDGEPSIPPDRQETLAKGIPVRRLATPEDLAGLVVWLGSAANSYVSGQTITLSGGAQS